MTPGSMRALWQVGGVIPEALRGFLRNAAGGEAGGLTMMQRSQEQMLALEAQASGPPLPLPAAHSEGAPSASTCQKRMANGGG